MHDSQWYVDFYSKYGSYIERSYLEDSIMDLHPCWDGMIAGVPCRLTNNIDNKWCDNANVERDVVNMLQCRELLLLCTKRQQKVLKLVLEGYRIVDISEILGNAPTNVSDMLRRIRKRLLEKGFGPELLK